MKKLIYSLMILLTSLLLQAGEIKVAVAANVNYAIDDLKKEFGKLYPNIKVQVLLGSSGKLTAQIKNGAPYQLFMSANIEYPKALYKEGIAITRPIVYAQGNLALFSSKKQDFSQGIKLVESLDIKKIAVANPKTAPYGKAAIEAMKNSRVYKNVKNKFVYAESISHTVSYAITAADIGFVAKSSLYSPKMAKYQKGINWSEVNPELYTPINQGIVILKNGEADADVAAFYAFMLSKKAQKILQKYGYQIP